MEHYDYNSTSSSSSAIIFQPSKDFPAKMAASSTPEIDGLLADAGYLVKSSDLVSVVHHLENVMVAAQQLAISHLAYDAVCYNSTHIIGWVESMIGELGPSALLEFLVADFSPIDFASNYHMPMGGFQMQPEAGVRKKACSKDPRARIPVQFSLQWILLSHFDSHHNRPRSIFPSMFISLLP